VVGILVFKRCRAWPCLRDRAVVSPVAGRDFVKRTLCWARLACPGPPNGASNCAWFDPNPEILAVHAWDGNVRVRYSLPKVPNPNRQRITSCTGLVKDTSLRPSVSDDTTNVFNFGLPPSRSTHPKFGRAVAKSGAGLIVLDQQMHEVGAPGRDPKRVCALQPSMRGSFNAQLRNQPHSKVIAQPSLDK